MQNQTPNLTLEQALHNLTVCASEHVGNLQVHEAMQASLRLVRETLFPQQNQPPSNMKIVDTVPK